MPQTDTALRIVDPTPPDTVEATTPLPLRVGLSLLDEVALTAGTEGIDGDLATEAKDLATALAGDDANAARVRTIARVITIEKARLQLLQARAGGLVAAGQLDAALKVDRLMTGATRRLERLLRLHRDEARGTTPNTMMVIGHADRVDLSEKV